jgi:hypothetical protein
MDNKECDDLFADELGFTAGKTIDFLNAERNEEKTDVNEKKFVDDYLNFNDESYIQQQALPVLMPTVKDEQLKFSEPQEKADDEFLNPYEITNEKFISSEDLISDFKDPIPEPAEEEIAKPAPAPVIKKAEPEAPKPKEIAPPVKASKSDDIEAEKIFKSIGLGKRHSELHAHCLSHVSVDDSYSYGSNCASETTFHSNFYFVLRSFPSLVSHSLTLSFLILT